MALSCTDRPVYLRLTQLYSVHNGWAGLINFSAVGRFICTYSMDMFTFFFGTWWPVCTVLSRVEKYRVTIPLSRFFDQEKLSFLPEAHTCFNQLVLPDYRNKVREYVLYKCTLGSTSPCGDPQSISLDLPDWSILRSFRANSFSLQLTVGQDPSFDDVGSPDVQETGFVKYQLWKAQVC